MNYCAGLDGPIGVPIISPETTISTRRFFCRPAAVSLDATGLSLPKPLAVMSSGAMPSPIR